MKLSFPFPPHWHHVLWLHLVVGTVLVVFLWRQNHPFLLLMTKFVDLGTFPPAAYFQSSLPCHPNFFPLLLVREIGDSRSSLPFSPC